jgi:hypothetical protein
LRRAFSSYSNYSNVTEFDSFVLAVVAQVGGVEETGPDLQESADSAIETIDLDKKKSAEVEAQVIQPIVLKSVCDDELALPNASERYATTETTQLQPKNSFPLKRMWSRYPAIPILASTTVGSRSVLIIVNKALINITHVVDRFSCCYYSLLKRKSVADSRARKELYQNERSMQEVL